MTDKPLSRQRRWQLARIAEGKCQTCGMPRNLYSSMCDICQEKSNELQRTRKRCLTWKPGSPGRPPIWWKRQQEQKKAEVASGQN